MTEKMGCQTIQELLPAYLLDALEIDEELAVLEHLRTCEACRAEADALRPVANTLGLAASDAGRPSPHTKLQVMARIATVPDPRAAIRPPRRSIFRPMAALVSAAVALILIFGLGAVVASLQTQLSQQQARLDRYSQQQVALGQFMLQDNLQPVTLKIDNPSADAVMYASADQVAMAVTGLPTLEGNSVYQCWWIDSQTGEVAPGTTFKVDANGGGVWVWQRPREANYDKMAITKESGPDNTKAEGPVMLTAEF
jgi:hypothetical protein